MNLDLQKVLPAEAFETEQNEGDYIGKDGLLYCGVCRTKKQTRLPASDFTGGREIIVPCICKCKVEENKRKEEEEKKRQEMQRLERLKASSLMDAKLKAARLDGYQVDGDNQKIYNLAGNYVKRFDEMYEKRQEINRISDFVHCSDQIDELSFRQMVNSRYETEYYNDDFLKTGHNKGLWHYIRQKDYNIYYAENRIYTKFSEIEADAKEER